MRITGRTAAVAAAWTAVGAIGAATLTGVASAGTSSTPTPSGSRASASAGAVGSEHRGDGHRLRMLGGRVLHGDFVVEGKNGAYVDGSTQRGTVTAASATSLTVRSADGTSWTWALTSDTRVRLGRAAGTVGALKKDVTVRVMGTRSGDTRTAKLVVVRPAGAPADGGSAQAG